MLWPMAGFGRIFCISINLACALAARSYPVDGLVVSVNPPVLTVAHRPIKGYMPAMTMDFRAASPQELESVRVGKRVRFEFRDGLARGIRIVAPDEKDMPAAATPLRLGARRRIFSLLTRTTER